MTVYRYRDTELELEVSRDGEQVTVTRVTADGDEHGTELEARRVGSAEFVVRDPDDPSRHHTIHAVRDGNHWWINLDGRSYHLERQIARAGGAASKGGLIAPIPATVQEVLVSDGDEVADGQVLLVLTAMKMQIEIKAPHAGTVKGLSLKEGDKVDGGVQLFEVVAAGK